ncbi:hypothetical protein ZWY2020_036132 [Hordeum vulgare]|nr:hypothetical protein ZWY2020_036132 [Hordeum vulgare]
MATSCGSDDGDGGGAHDASDGSGARADPTEVCDSSNPYQAPPPHPPSSAYCLEYAAVRAFAKVVKEYPEGSHHYASSFGGVSIANYN